MENGFIDKVEDNAAIRIWSEKTRLEKGDSLTEGYVSELWDFTCISLIQNNHQQLKEIWVQWDNEIKQLFYCNYGDLPYLLDIKVDKHLLIVFPKALGHVDEAILDLFDIFDKKVKEDSSDVRNSCWHGCIATFGG
ncbi:hypothetical protein Gotur_029591 [Gossypium turneri]